MLGKRLQRIIAPERSSRKRRRHDAESDVPTTTSPTNPILSLQRTIGNRATQTLLAQRQIATPQPNKLPPLTSLQRAPQEEANPLTEIQTLVKANNIDGAIEKLAGLQSAAEPNTADAAKLGEQKENKGKAWQQLTDTYAYTKYREGSSDKNEIIVKAIKAIRDGIAASNSTAEQKAKWYMRISELQPFYTQMANSNFLPRNAKIDVDKKGNLKVDKDSSHAWTRTCNVTALAMALNGLGIGTRDFLGNKAVLLKIGQHFDPKMTESDLFGLRMPDFLQLVVLYFNFQYMKMRTEENEAAAAESTGKKKKKPKRKSSSEAVGVEIDTDDVSEGNDFNAVWKNAAMDSSSGNKFGDNVGNTSLVALLGIASHFGVKGEVGAVESLGKKLGETKEMDKIKKLRKAIRTHESAITKAGKDTTKAQAALKKAGEDAEKKKKAQDALTAAETAKKTAETGKTTAEADIKKILDQYPDLTSSAYRAKVISKIVPLLKSGAQIFLTRPGHYLRLQSVVEDETKGGIIVDDPADLGKNALLDWTEANLGGYLRNYTVLKK